MTMASSLAAALYFDTELASNVEPFARLTATLFSSKEHQFVQFSMPIENTKARPPSSFDVPKLLKRITDGQVSLVAVETEAKTPDHDQMRVSVTTTPIAQRPERFFSQTRCRYVCHAQFGPSPLAALGTQRVLDALIAFADAVQTRAGIVLWADTTLFASCLVSTGSSSKLTRDEDQQVLASMDGQSRWGDTIRGPQWGTFLGSDHVARLGGIERIERDSRCARVVGIASGGAFLQATTIDDPIVVGHDDGGKLARLTAFLAPVMAANTGSA